MTSSGAAAALARASQRLEEVRESMSGTARRTEALDLARGAVLDARRARARPEELIPLFISVCVAAGADSAPTARILAPQIVEELCLRDLPAFAAPATSFLKKALEDGSVLVVTRAVRALTALFRKFLGFCVHDGVGTDQNAFPETGLKDWLEMERTAVNLVDSPDDGLRKAAVKFAETVVLALSYSGGPGTPDYFSLDYAARKGVNSALLTVTRLEEEGRRCVRVVSTLVQKGLDAPAGSAGGLAPASFMTAIAVLGNLVRRRRKLLEVTLPPLLSVVAAITNSTGKQPPAFSALTGGQRRSIILVLRLSLLALRTYPHASSGEAGRDVTIATNNLAAYERHLGQLQRVAAVDKKERAPQLSSATPDVSIPLAKPEPTLVKYAPGRRAPGTLKRPRVPDARAISIQLPAGEAFSAAQTLIQAMPPMEVINFIMTRILINIPTERPGGGESRPPPSLNTAVVDERTTKRARKSRFEASEADPAPRKVASVRRVAPPVVAPKLSDSTRIRFVALCCRRIMQREDKAVASGAGPLRTLLLSRLLALLASVDTEDAHAFCDEACAFIAENVHKRLELAVAWLHALIVAEELSSVTMKEEVGVLLHDIGDYERETWARQRVGEEGDEASHAILDVAAATIEGSATDNAAVTGNDLSAVGRNTELGGATDKTTTDTAAERLSPNSANPEPASICTPEAASTMDESPGVALCSGEMKAEDVISRDSDTKADANMKMDVEKEEWVEDELDRPLTCKPAYECLLTKLLHQVKEKVSGNDSAFSRLVIEAPVIPVSVVDMLRDACRDPARSKLGLTTLRDVVIERAGNDRKQCLEQLLLFTVDEEPVLRGPAIRLVANKLFVDRSGTVPDAIESFALTSLSNGIATVTKYGENEETLSQLERGSMLITALCAQKHELLRLMASTYASASEPAQRVVLSRAKDLAGHLGMDSEPVLQLIRGTLMSDNNSTSGDGLEGLALELVLALVKKFGRPTRALVDAACARCDLCSDLKFVTAVLSGLKRAEVVRYLDGIVHSSGPDGVGFKAVISTLMGSQPVPLSAAELLVELHALKADKDVGAASRACFDMRAVFKQEVVAKAIQQLVERTEIPGMLMRTVLLARVYHPELEKYLTENVMLRLIEKRVWLDASLWEGFLMYCENVKGLNIVLRLPTAQLDDALTKKVGLVKMFQELVSNPKSWKKIPPKHRKVLNAAIERLSLEPPQQQGVVEG